VTASDEIKAGGPLLPTRGVYPVLMLTDYKPGVPPFSRFSRRGLSGCRRQGLFLPHNRTVPAVTALPLHHR